MTFVPGLTSKGLTRDFCSRLASIRYEDLPEKVVSNVKLFLLDSLGTLAAGAAAPGVNTLIRRLTQWERAGNATVLLGGERVSPPSAALANAAAAHALDYDDQHDDARVHSYCSVMPATLAAAEDKGEVTGGAFLAALTVGVEAHARLGLACPGSLGRGWMPTVTFGTLACAMAAGHVLGLDAGGMTNAMGIAYHQASGNGQARHEQTLTKRVGPGFAARSGVLAAFLAMDGISGPQCALEGRSGLFQLYEAGEADPVELTRGWMESWRVLEFSMKPYPGCRCGHAVVDMGIALHEAGINPDEIVGAEIHLGQVNYDTVKGVFDVARRSQVHAQFNAAYNLARALVDGHVDLRSFEPEALVDVRVAALASRIRTLSDPTIPARAIEPARLTVRLRDGTVIERKKDTMSGSPHEPLSVAQVMAKFEDCLAFGLSASPDEARRLADCVMNLERGYVSDLVAAFPRLHFTQRQV